MELCKWHPGQAPHLSDGLHGNLPRLLDGYVTRVAVRLNLGKAGYAANRLSAAAPAAWRAAMRRASS